MTRNHLWGTSAYAQLGTLPGTIPASTSQGEIDLRQWFDDIIFGANGNVQHGHWHIIRHMRRNSDGSMIPCSCKNELTGEGSPSCPYCLGEGYLWDEQWYMGRSAMVGPEGGLANRDRFVPAGIVRVDYKVFYFRYDTPIKQGDKVVEVLLDTEGKIVVPYKRTAIYKPQVIDAKRSDNGRIEFFQVYCREDDALRPDEFTD